MPGARESDNMGIVERYQMAGELLEQFSETILEKAELAEKWLHLVHWSDPRITSLFLLGCAGMAVALVAIPASFTFASVGLWYLRPPSLRRKAKAGPGRGSMYDALVARLPTNASSGMCT